MDRDPPKTAAREQKRRDRLPADAACALCGETDPFKLRVATEEAVAGLASRQFLERHHMMGRHIDPDLTVVLCLNHHAEATESLRRGGIGMEPRKNVLELLVLVLKAVSAFLENVLRSIERWIQRIERFIRSLDSKCPAWRETEA
jgi:hypothetical protein